MLSNFLLFLEGSAELDYFMMLLLEDLSDLGIPAIPKWVVFLVIRILVVSLLAILDQLRLMYLKVYCWPYWLCCKRISKASIVVCFECSVR